MPAVAQHSPPPPLPDGVTLKDLENVDAARKIAAAVSKALAQRRRVETHQSQVDDPESPYHDLWKPAPFKVYYGGRGAAKDWSFAEVLVRRVAVEPIVVLCTREYQKSIKDSVHRVLKRMIARLGLEAEYDVTDQSIRSKVGGEFIFDGLHHNITEIKSKEGVVITWVAEAQNTTEESWVELLPTVFREPNSEVWISFNVTDVNAPTHVRFVTKPPEGAIVHKVNYTENKYFPEGLRKLMVQDRENDQQMYRHVWLGEPRALSNALVLGGRYKVKEFADDLFKKAKRVFFGADFGYANDPSTLLRYFALTSAECKYHGLLKGDGSGLADFQNADGKWNVTSDRLFIEHEAGGAGIEIDELPELYDSVPGSRDWPIKADAARPEVISYLHSKGFRITAAEKWNGSVEDGLAHLRSHVIIIHPRCVKTEAECGTYSYKVDPKQIDPRTNAPVVLPVLIDAHNHYIDSARYGMDGYIQRRGAGAVWAKLGQQAREQRR